MLGSPSISPPPVTPEAIKGMAAIAPKYGITILPPAEQEKQYHISAQSIIENELPKSDNCGTYQNDNLKTRRLSDEVKTERKMGKNQI